MKKRAPETKAADLTTVEETRNELVGFDLGDLAQDAGLGNEGMGVGDLLMPYLYILQANSPQVNPGKPVFIEGSSASMFYNVANERIYDGRNTGILVVPCAQERKFVEWKDRDSGGGWIGDHDIESDILEYCEKDDKGRWRMKVGGNNIVETAYHYCLYLDEMLEFPRWDKCIIPMKSTALKASRRLNGMCNEALVPGTQTKAPRFLFKYRMKTHLETKGENSWWGPSFDREGMVTPAVYKNAKEFYTLFSGGMVDRKPETMVVAEEGATIPF